MNKETIYKFFGCFIFTSIIFLSSKDIPFFWDNVLSCSKMGHHVYENGLFNFNYPPKFDSGYPPLIPFTNALAWKIFGKHLWASHLVFCIFTFGFVWQLNNVIAYFIKKQWQQIASLCFVFCDATVLSQQFFIGIETPQLFFFFLALHSIFKSNKIQKCIAILFLGLCSQRGMMLGIGLFFIELMFNNFQKVKFSLKLFIPYALASIPSIIFLLWHKTTQGHLMQTQQNSEWGEYWQIVDFKGLLFNIIVVIQRFLDFGRVFVFLFLFILIIINKSILKDKKFQLLASACILSVSLIIIVSLAYKNPMGHRYFAESFCLIIILTSYLVFEYCQKKLLWFIGLCILLAIGNLWVYPKNFTQGWDASLKSLPYFSLHNDAVNYLQNNKILIDSVGTFAHNKYSSEELKLNGDTSSFKEFDSTNQYVFISNVHNIKPKNYEELFEKYVLKKRFESQGIWIEILEKRYFVGN